MPLRFSGPLLLRWNPHAFDVQKAGEPNWCGLAPGRRNSGSHRHVGLNIPNFGFAKYWFWRCCDEKNQRWVSIRQPYVQI